MPRSGAPIGIRQIPNLKVWIGYFPTAWYQRLVRFIWLGTNQDQSFATLFLVVNQSLPAITGYKGTDFNSIPQYCSRELITGSTILRHWSFCHGIFILFYGDTCILKLGERRSLSTHQTRNKWRLLRFYFRVKFNEILPVTLPLATRQTRAK